MDRLHVGKQEYTTIITNDEEAKQCEDRETRELGVSEVWQPWTLSHGVLISAILFTTGLVAILGLLEWQNARNGALFMATSSDGFSEIQNFLYRYLPTIIIVLYGVWWSWIDLDIKRLEPWYQLSQAEGATAEHSLLMHYPVDFLPFVPFKAAKRRQWAVFSGSMIMIFVVWVITPLQNGIFNSSVLTQQRDVALQISSELRPLSDQDSVIDISLLNQAYSVVWLDQKLPDFTTPSFAVAPFSLVATDQVLGTNQTLYSNTTLYATEIDCRPPANVSMGAGTVTLDDGKGCIARDVIAIASAEESKSFVSYYIGYYDDPEVDQSLRGSGCPQSAEHTFLAIWKAADNYPPNFADPKNATALFCSPSYYKQAVNASVSLPGNTIVSTKALGPKVPLTDDEFNTTRFEYLLANANTGDQVRMDISATTILHQDLRLNNMSLYVPAPNMVAYAIGLTRHSPQAYLDPAVFSGALQTAHQLLFALAAQALFAVPDKSTSARGVAESTFQTISLIPIFSLLSQAFMVLVVCCSCYLLYSTKRRGNALVKDPDTLAEVLSLARDTEVRQLFNGVGAASESALRHKLEPYRFRLRAQGRRVAPLIEAYATTTSITQHQSHSGGSAERLPVSTATGIQPFEYNAIVGMALTICLSSLIFVLIFLHQKILRQGGLGLPSQNAVVQQILLNFLPTIAATLLEPVLVLISRLTCLMQPMERLRQGKATAKASLLARYTSIPPQIALWRAIRSGEYLLACLCLLAVLANVLTVALSGLFSIDHVVHGQSLVLRPSYQAQLVAANDSNAASILEMYSQNDVLYVASSNLSSNTTLPAWTAPEAYFLPQSLPRPADDTSELILHTTGYSADLNCVELTQTPSNATYELVITDDAKSVQMVMSFIQDDSSTFQCKLLDAVVNASTTSKSTTNVADFEDIGGDPTGRKAFEVSEGLVPLNGSSVSSCGGYITSGWVRADLPTVPSDSTSRVRSLFDVSATFIACKPRLKSALYNITVSESGTILDTQQVSEMNYDNLDGLRPAVDQTMAAFNGGSVPPSLTWHNDTIAADWRNYLIKLHTNSTALVDATLEPPPFETAANLSSQIFSRLFAIQMSLMSSQLLPADNATQGTPAELLTLQPRVFMSENLFWIAIVILSIDLVVIVIFYWHLPKPFLPRMPTSVASQIAFFAGSHVIDDVTRAGGDLCALDQCGYRYGYGKYIGQDGCVHVGIERAPYVVRLDDHGPGKWSWWKRSVTNDGNA